MNVTTHRDNYLKRHPAVNVKVYRLDLTPEQVRHRYLEALDELTA